MKRLLLTALSVVLVGCQSQPTQFAIIGDNPYEVENYPRYDLMVQRINDSGADWVIHLGDMKSGGGSCADEELQRVFDINQQFEIPFALTPGDNDWFDCERESAGGFDRLERLDKLREIFYSKPPALPIVSQSTSETYGDFVENVYWLDDQVMFATVHLVGLDGSEGGVSLHLDVENAAIEWLNTLFDAAIAANAKGIFVAMHADIYPFSGDPGWLKFVCGACAEVRPLYERFHEALLAQSRRYTRPIMLAMGDTHIFRVDKPLYDNGKLVEHVTRVEGFGEDAVHWVRIEVHPDASDVFRVRQELIRDNVSGSGEE
ncbi:MAG: metallophosphoesterase [Pseudomonadales bacterium]|nr:metallophosphoesterase [Pseudomonadales bacterium]MBO6563349.1 metallophosphoesterase [Pseudomonadales bacterium]MBO6597850.1 metallophosphoesterase [Pseudomonadales bacterium]MBO6702328.1 metallophosphoesterase [Pseudomonadales bacterium]MBO6824258.1 metallophosphoesterase [Pseudomonadales bacterium]